MLLFTFAPLYPLHPLCSQTRIALRQCSRRPRLRSASGEAFGEALGEALGARAIFQMQRACAERGAA